MDRMPIRAAPAGVKGRLMSNLPVIDAEFEVIELAFADRDDTPTDHAAYQAVIDAERWNFWDDDLPNLAGIVGGFATAIALALHWPR